MKNWTHLKHPDVLTCKGPRQIQDNYKMYYWSLSIHIFFLLVFFPLDIDRTFPDNIHFTNKQNDLRPALYNVLVAYAKHNPRIGYCQVHIYCKLPLLSPGLTCLSNYKRCLRKAYKWRGLYPGGLNYKLPGIEKALALIKIWDLHLLVLTIRKVANINFLLTISIHN